MDWTKLNTAFEGMLGSPLAMVGLGLLSAARDRRQNPYEAAMQGLLMSSQYQQQRKQHELQEKLYGMRVSEVEAKQEQAQLARQQAQAQQAALQQVQGLLGEGRADEAARVALTSGVPQLMQWGGGLLSPQKDNTPAAIQTAQWYQNATPEQRAAFDRVNGREVASYFTPVQTSSGYMSFNNRTGQMEPMTGQDGKPVLPVAADPAVQQEVAYGKAAGQTKGKVRTEAQIELPGYLQNAQYSIELIDKALAHPGREAATGLSSWNPLNLIPGSPARDFEAVREQLQGKTFLEAYESLKGGGHITEIEGTKAERSIARLQTSQSDAAFEASLRELREVIARGVERAMRKAGSGVVNDQVQTGGAVTPSVEDLLKKYGG